MFSANSQLEGIEAVPLASRVLISVWYHIRTNYLWKWQTMK